MMKMSNERSSWQFPKRKFENSGQDYFSHIKSILNIFTKIVFTFYNKAQGQGQVSFRS